MKVRCTNGYLIMRQGLDQDMVLVGLQLMSVWCLCEVWANHRSRPVREGSAVSRGMLGVCSRSMQLPDVPISALVLQSEQIGLPQPRRLMVQKSHRKGTSAGRIKSISSGIDGL